MYRNLLLIGGAVAASILGASAAAAATVDLGYCYTLGCSSISTLATGTNTVTTSGSESNGPGDTWVITDLSGESTPLAAPPTLLNGSAIAAQTSTGGSIYLFVTATGLTGPIATTVEALFQDVALSGGATLTEAAWYDPGDAAYAETDSLGSAALTNFSSNSVFTAVSIAAAYSLTLEFELSSIGAGSVNADTSISTTPIPGTLPLFASGLAGFWAWSRRRKSTTANVIETACA
jgi:hypothetical protein